MSKLKGYNPSATMSQEFSVDFALYNSHIRTTFTYGEMKRFGPVETALFHAKRLKISHCNWICTIIGLRGYEKTKNNFILMPGKQLIFASINNKIQMRA